MRHWTLAALLLAAPAALADDWPQWMGPKGDGVYRETGVLTELPKAGLKYRWKKPIGMGYSGPAVAGGKVYVMDRKPDPKPGQKKKEPPKKDPKDPNKLIFPKDPVVERTLCLRADTGEQVWERSNEADYQISYGEGPRATPTVSGGRVYALGAMGLLECLNAADGKPVWRRDFPKEFAAPHQAWGWAAHPVLDGDRVVTLVGGNGAAVVAFHKDTGKELWRALDSEEVGYTPILPATLGGKPQYVVYLSDGIYGLEPATGNKLWGLTYPIEGKPSRPSVPITRPMVIEENKVYLTSGYEGELLIDLGPTGTTPKVVYHGGNIQRQDPPTGLHGLMATPILTGGLIVGVDFMGELRGLDPKTGERKWESMELFGGKKALFGNAFLTPHEDRCFVFIDSGDLWLGKFTAKGFENVSKTHLIDAVQPAPRARRKVVWTHPAYADKAVFVRNQQEIVCAELAADKY